jgi:hypothetical protein
MQRAPPKNQAPRETCEAPHGPVLMHFPKVRNKTGRKSKLDPTHGTSYSVNQRSMKQGNTNKL